MYGYFAAWRDEGAAERIHDLLRRRLRRARGRGQEPGAVAVDSQSVKASGSAAPDPVGFDGNKKIKGRKRHIAVDTNPRPADRARGLGGESGRRPGRPIRRMRRGAHCGTR